MVIHMKLYTNCNFIEILVEKFRNNYANAMVVFKLFNVHTYTKLYVEENVMHL